MALSSFALITVAEAQRFIGIAGTEKRDLLEDVINAATDLIEQYLDRHIVTRGDVTEYHSPPHYTAELQLRDWPVIATTSVHEDTGWPRTYGASYLLTVSDDYMVVNPTGKLRRVDSAGLRAWAADFRTVKVVYSYGYANTAAVPERIKEPTKKLCALVWAEATREQSGVSGYADSVGNWTRFSPAHLTPEIKGELINERRMLFSSTSERDS